MDKNRMELPWFLERGVSCIVLSLAWKIASFFTECHRFPSMSVLRLWEYIKRASLSWWFSLFTLPVSLTMYRNCRLKHTLAAQKHIPVLERIIIGESARNVRLKIHGLPSLHHRSCSMIVYYMAFLLVNWYSCLFLYLDWSHECSRILDNIRWVRSTFCLRYLDALSSLPMSSRKAVAFIWSRISPTQPDELSILNQIPQAKKQIGKWKPVQWVSIAALRVVTQ